jgi:cephalosporin hydroxylase
VYPQFLDQIRHFPVSLLEIGVLFGESLRMWNEYFVHPGAKLHAWDIKPEYAKGIPSRFTFQQVDCFNRAQVRAAAAQLPNLDVVVDDGQHSPQAIKVPFEALWDKLNSGGLYIIEDVKFSRHPGVANMIFSKKCRSEVHIYGEVIVVRKI